VGRLPPQPLGSVGAGLLSLLVLAHAALERCIALAQQYSHQTNSCAALAVLWRNSRSASASKRTEFAGDIDCSSVMVWMGKWGQTTIIGTLESILSKNRRPTGTDKFLFYVGRSAEI
jgi:hypothetical protein